MWLCYNPYLLHNPQVNGLEVNKCYFFSVVVVNAAGQSEESAVSLNDICTVSAVTSGECSYTYVRM